MARPKTVYMVWLDGPDEQYYNQYESLEDAVSEFPDTEVFEAKPKSLGKFELFVKRVVKKSKKTNKEVSNGKTT